ncbi:MAG: phosphatidylserine decarboxylase family protein [Bacteroidaceae bacterium]|nr:phosphatidylserine decarboxylase family protein [Bacteroidaceae bacterium]MBR4782564.1 phosphatidylserine decarboxylase family protein [Bacteroidaceae bacterium]
MSTLNKIKKIKKIRLHHEGTSTLTISGILLLVFNALCYWIFVHLLHFDIPFYVILAVSATVYAIMVNFFRCPIRYFQGETDGIVVAPADGKVVVVEEVEENEYFHAKRKMVSIFMSLTNVHANWFPVDGVIRKMEHENGNFHKAWLPKASMENERSTIVIETEKYGEILVRQIAGAIARRIVTYAREGDDCYIDEHLGFIKFGSRVDVFLPLSAEITVKMGQKTVGNGTVIAKLSEH